MNHAELSKQLALALGWSHAEISSSGRECLVKQVGNLGWWLFDYRSPDVCLPLLKWLMKEHEATVGDEAVVFVKLGTWPSRFIYKATLEEAIARAVIAVGVK